VVLLCHGLGDHKDAFHLPALATALAGSGLGSLRLDFPGNGESPGDFRYSNMRDEARDITPADPDCHPNANAAAIQSSGQIMSVYLGHTV
jgi:predicted alpha/beta-hydrolase family hydrolase